MSYKYLCFIREDKKNQKRGFIAGLPLDKFPSYCDPFIVVKIKESLVKKEMLGDGSIRLKLDELMKQYPNTKKEVEDADGNIDLIDVYGYFNASGRSSEKDCPVITLSDLLWGE